MDNHTFGLLLIIVGIIELFAVGTFFKKQSRQLKRLISASSLIMIVIGIYLLS